MCIEPPYTSKLMNMAGASRSILAWFFQVLWLKCVVSLETDPTGQFLEDNQEQWRKPVGFFFFLRRLGNPIWSVLWSPHVLKSNWSNRSFFKKRMGMELHSLVCCCAISAKAHGDLHFRSQRPYWVAHHYLSFELQEIWSLLLVSEGTCNTWHTVTKALKEQ